MSWTIDPIPPTGLGAGRAGEDAYGYIGDFRLARLHERLAATAVDIAATALAPVFIAWVFAKAFPVTQTVCQFGMCQQVTGPRGLGATPFVLCLLLVTVNSIVIQGYTGQSLGKYVMGLTLASPIQTTDLGPSLVYPGVARTLARFLALACIDYVILIGILRPAWHGRRQTFGDSILGTVVVADPIELLVGDGPRL